MTTQLRHLALIAVLPIAVLAVACAETADDTEEGMMDDTTAMLPPADDPMDDMEMDDGMGGTAELVVTNPMPHAMIVAVDEDGQATELGSVPANGEATFSVSVPAEGSLTVTAHDEANTHSPSTTVMVAEGEGSVAWTIE